jgi:hypothetical protein
MFRKRDTLNYCHLVDASLPALLDKYIRVAERSTLGPKRLADRVHLAVARFGI